MSLFVNTNMSSLRAQQGLNKISIKQEQSLSRLSSGLRLNSAKDGSADLHISDRLTAQIQGMDQGNRNVREGIAILQTMDGAVEEYANILQKLRTLAVQASTGTLTEADRIAVNKQNMELSKELMHIARETTYGGAQVLDGASNNEAGGMKRPNLIPCKKVRGGNSGFIANPRGAGVLTFHLGTHSGDTVQVDAEVGFRTDFLFEEAMGHACPIARSEDDVPKQTRDGIIFTKEIDLGRWKYTGPRFVLSTQETAQLAIGTIDKLLGYVNSQRAQYGSAINRMESALRTQTTSIETQSDVRSRIRDTDFASETASLTQSTMLQQASQSILTQANQRPNLAMLLLR